MALGIKAVNKVDIFVADDGTPYTVTGTIVTDEANCAKVVLLFYVERIVEA